MILVVITIDLGFFILVCSCIPQKTLSRGNYIPSELVEGSNKLGKNARSNRRGRGRPTTGPSPRIVNDVKKLLPQDGSDIRYKDLESAWIEAEGSVGTLVKYLRILEKSGVVLREIDNSVRPPGVYYRLLIEEFFPEGREFYRLMVLDVDGDLEKILAEEDPVTRFKNLSSRLFLELTTMTALIKRILERCGEGMLPEAAKEYVDVAFKVHLLPWVKRLAAAACRPDGPGDLDLEAALDPLRLLHQKPFLEWVEEYRRMLNLPGLEETYGVLRLGRDAAER